MRNERDYCKKVLIPEQKYDMTKTLEKRKTSVFFCKVSVPMRGRLRPEETIKCVEKQRRHFSAQKKA